MASGIRSALDRYFPAGARAYRKLRDDRWYAKLREVPNDVGLRLIAEPGQIASIAASGEFSTIQAVAAAADVFVDIGANVGLYACVAAKMGKYVVAAEPHPLNLQCIYQNLQRNDLARQCEVHAVAVSSEQGVADLFGGQQGGSLQKGWSGIESNYRNIVFVSTLDRLLEDRFLSKKLAIKVDVEGNEYPLLLGARATLDRTIPPVWMVEIGLTENFAGSVNPHFRDIFEIFWTHGYQASSASLPDRQIAPGDVDRWISERKTDFADINYRFTKNPN